MVRMEQGGLDPVNPVDPVFFSGGFTNQVRFFRKRPFYPGVIKPDEPFLFVQVDSSPGACFQFEEIG